MKEYKNAMLICPDEVKANGLVNYNVDDTTIGYAIRTAQDIYLQEILGGRLFNRLKELVYNAIVGKEDNIDEPNNVDYAILLEEYVEPYLIAKSTVECLMPLSYKIRNIGVSKDSDTNIQATQLNELQYVINYNQTMVAEYATRLSSFLCLRMADYSELEECTTCDVIKPQIGKKYANVPLYLGNNKKCKCNCK